MLESYLQTRQLSFDTLRRTLRQRVPALIAVPFDAAGPTVKIDQAVLAIGGKLKRLGTRRSSSSGESLAPDAVAAAAPPLRMSGGARVSDLMQAAAESRRGASIEEVEVV